MIDFNHLLVNRLIIHTINARQPNQDHATVDLSTEICEIDHTALGLIRSRLIDALGKNSKAFELEIQNVSSDSFFSLSKDLSILEDKDFTARSGEIAELLAENQTRSLIPGGYLLIIDCLDNESNLPLVIVIKAEPHEALQFSLIQGHSQINILNKVFLSPSQKLYKIGIIYEKKTQSTLINEKYGCILYDDQFRADSHPAEYFYKGFLGFSIGKNAKIQTQRFFDKTYTFICNNIADTETKFSLISILKNQFTVNNSATINPYNFANEYIPASNGLKDIFIREVCSELPHSIVKDISLIRLRLSKRKIDFPNSIILNGPENEFDHKVEIIQNQSQLDALSIDDPSYTILKIAGKPYSSSDE